MRDDDFTGKVERVEAILEELEQGEATLEEGKQLKQEAIQLLEDADELLDRGGGKVVVVEEHDGEVVEKPLDLASGQ